MNDAQALETMANDANPDVRAGVAYWGNDASPELLDLLANDEDEFVREQVAINPKADVKTLNRLAGDEEMHVRKNVAMNTSTSVETLDLLASDEVWFVQQAVAGNRNISPETMARLANTQDRNITAVLLSNPNIPSAVKQFLLATGVRPDEVDLREEGIGSYNHGFCR